MSKPSALETAAAELLAKRHHGILATHSHSVEGYPFGSMTPFCLDDQQRPLLLISRLAQHTQNIHRDPRVSLTLWEEGEGDVQQLARLVYMADAKALDEQQDQSSMQRYFQHYPGTRDYYQHLDFEFYRLKPVKAHFVGGFGKVN